MTGTVEGLESGPAEIHEGVVNGDTVSFWLNYRLSGPDVQAGLQGQGGGGPDRFDFGTDEGSWSTPLTVKKEGAEAAAARGSGGCPT